MAQPRVGALFGRDFARRLWRLTRLYWTSSDAKKGGLLLATALVPQPDGRAALQAA